MQKMSVSLLFLCDRERGALLRGLRVIPRRAFLVPPQPSHFVHAENKDTPSTLFSSSLYYITYSSALVQMDPATGGRLFFSLLLHTCTLLCVVVHVLYVVECAFTFLLTLMKPTPSLPCVLLLLNTTAL